MTHVSLAVQQQGYRWRNDDGAEGSGGATWRAVEGSPVSVVTNTNLRLRILLRETGGGTSSGSTLKLKYGVNGGSLVTITNSSSLIKFNDSSNLTNGNDTTQQLGSATYISSNACVVDNDADGVFGSVSFSANSEVEIEVSLNVTGTQGDQYRFEVTNGDDSALAATPDIPVLIIAGNPAEYTTITAEETHTVVAESSSSATLPQISGGTDMLYVVAVSLRGTTSVSSISGGGLTWTLRKRQQSGRSIGAVEVWTAHGSPSAFSAAITMSGSTTSFNATIIRYSGTDMSTPIEDAVGHNTNGENGAATGGTDSASPQLTTGSTNADSVHFAILFHRNSSITTPDADYLNRMIYLMDNDLAGDVANSLVVDNFTSATGDDTFNVTLGSAQDWATAGFVIIPATSGVTVSPGFASAAMSAEGGSPILGSLTLTAGNAPATMTSEGGTPVLGSINLSPGNAQAVMSAEGSNSILGSLSLSPGNAQAVMTSEGGTPVLGSLSLSPGNAPATMSAEGVTVIEGGGGLTVTPGFAVATMSAEGGSAILGSLSLSPGNAQAVMSAEGVNLILGSISLSPGNAQAVMSAEGVNLILGSISLSPGNAQAIMSAEGVTVLEGGGLSLAPGNALVTMSAVGGNPILGSLNLSAGFTSTIMSAEGGAAILGSLSLSPGNAQAMMSAEGAATILGSLTLTGGIVTSIMSAEGGAAVQGSLNLSPGFVNSTLSAEGVTMILGNITLAAGVVIGTFTAEGVIIISTADIRPEYLGTMAEYILFEGEMSDYALFVGVVSEYELFTGTMEDDVTAESGYLGKLVTLSKGPNHNGSYSEPDSITFYVKYAGVALENYPWDGADTANVSQNQDSGGNPIPGQYRLHVAATKKGNALVQYKAVWVTPAWVLISPIEPVEVEEFLGA